jgi:hypothetical protein
MATAAVDRTLKVWDVRKLEGPLQQYKLHAVASNLAFSQRGLLAVGMGNVVEVTDNICFIYSIKSLHFIVSYSCDLILGINQMKVDLSLAIFNVCSLNPIMKVSNFLKSLILWRNL